MQQLSGLDATFLYLETAQMPMHVGALHLFELPPGYPGKFVTALRKHIASRLPVAPVLRRRLWWMPLNLANPAWVDAEPDLRRHIVEIKLPKGAGLPALEAEVSRLHSVLLDRERPLWKMHVFEGLAPGANGHRRVGLYTQLHHAAVDGQAAVALANAIMDLSPVPRAIESRSSRRNKVFRLEMTEMLRGVLGNQAQKVAEIVRGLPATVGTLKNAASRAISGSALLGGKGGPSNLTLAPRTPLNVSVTTGRAFAAVTLPLAEVKALGRAHGATINDMVLMLCSSALRRHYAKRRQLPRKSLVAAVPITLREAGDTSPDNQASMSLVSLGTNIADTRKRLAHVQAATASMKSTMGDLKSILPTDFPSLGVPWLIEAATKLYGKARVADRIPQVANLVISNVPGPPVPLYMAGAKMLTNYPTSIVVHGLALNITVQSYDRSLDFGFMADGQALPDVRELADAIVIAFDDLRALARPGEPDPEEAPPPGVVGRAARGITDVVTGATGVVTGAMGKVARQVMTTAVETAVSQVTGRGAARAPAKRPAARKSR
ncbi:MAG: wax ester/triacylglycerol synthase family O-acyltransferase [Betaproteobacteria bacterium]|nr:wax ester/triacylglycerol synthase family O-acyltransferase [Betaproteobacteria bacterium]MBK9682035.1 wax ester/triacylglycerol synthase family O-acyltransferase [Betaproteobacteria bacterium]MBL0295928.1 wax ester/triacylglycerol synthase family O-acyltransferase [Betaproteobacteria bacterium]